MSDRNRPRALNELLAQTQGLQQLIRAASQVQTLTEDVRGQLPADLRPHLISVAVRERMLVLVADSPAWAARLRFHGREIRTFVGCGQGAEIDRVSIRVRPAPDPGTHMGGQAGKRGSAGEIAD